MVRPAFDIDQLTIGERLELIERLWESLRGRPEWVPMSQQEQELIAARRAAHRSNPSAAVLWESVRAELEADQEADEHADPSDGDRDI